MKTIQNEHHKKLLSVIAGSLDTSDAMQSCISTMKQASFDSAKKAYVYSYPEDFENVVILDQVTQQMSHHLAEAALTPSAVDAVCISKDNEWFLLEFKNTNFYKRNTQIITGNERTEKAVSDSRKKMLSSIWFLLSLYSKSGNAHNDATLFAREHITYIGVFSYSENLGLANLIHMKEASGKHFTPPEYKKYKGYYFKDLYVLTERELRNFIVSLQ